MPLRSRKRVAAGGDLSIRSGPAIAPGRIGFEDHLPLLDRPILKGHGAADGILFWAFVRPAPNRAGHHQAQQRRTEPGNLARNGRAGKWLLHWAVNPSTGKPSARLARFRYVVMSMLSLMNCTDPSQSVKNAPPVWKLPSVVGMFVRFPLVF